MIETRPILVNGDHAAELRPLVALVQRITGIDPDGEFGERTEAAVRSFQRRERIAETGMVDAATWERIDAAVIRSSAGIGQAITIAATTDIGQRETVAYRGFVDKAFQRDLQALGWHQGQAWDVYAARRWWGLAYAAHAEIVATLERMFSGSAARTLKNFQRSGRFVVSMQPQVGALCFDRYSIRKTRVSVVTNYHVGADTFRCVAGRAAELVTRSNEGYIITEEDAPVVSPLTLRRGRLGFVYPIEV